MTSQLATPISRPRRRPDVPYHVHHDSFEGADAEMLYGPATAQEGDFEGSHMPDEVTRDLARRMHYAAWRTATATATGERGRQRWREIYLEFRDRVVVGNRKLIYRAVQRWSPPTSIADDMVGDCQIVLIQAVSAYNPFLGVRFSTYVFTCLMRALSRISHRRENDRLAQWQPLETLADGEMAKGKDESLGCALLSSVDFYLREENDLLSSREKRVLVRRFRLDDTASGRTLEQVGKELGLSKERVRQVQESALGKLRKALALMPGQV